MTAARKHAHHAQQAKASVRQEQARIEELLLTKSPPVPKNLQHVPCKFYRSGQCTAGRNCVFSHIVEQEQERPPCKYFQKGNCRFGAKCALAHSLPDGRREQQTGAKVGRTASQQADHFARIVPEHRQQQPSGIHAELLQSQGQGSSESLWQDEIKSAQSGAASIEGRFSNIHLAQSEQDARGRLPTRAEGLPPSPARTHLGPLDAQLPASLDSNGISYFARHGPVAASVPHTTTFGIPDRASHPPSPLHLPTQTQASSSLFAPPTLLGTSPGMTVGSLTLGRAMFERRASALDTTAATSSDLWHAPASLSLSRSPIHARHGPLRPVVLSDERGAVTEDPFLFEEDFVPSSLNELLTPAERQRRLSMGTHGSQPSLHATLVSAATTSREELAQFSKSPTGSTNGSPSSSRFGALFLKHKEKEAAGLASPGSTAYQPQQASLVLPTSPRPSHLMTVGSPLARDLRASASSPGLLAFSPGRAGLVTAGPTGTRSGGVSRAETSDLRGEAKAFKMTAAAAAAASSDEEPFEMDI